MINCLTVKKILAYYNYFENGYSYNDIKNVTFLKCKIQESKVSSN